MTNTVDRPMPQRGDIWRENDPRMLGGRYVQVLAMGPDYIRIQRVSLDARDNWATHPGSRATEAKRERFDGRRGGYVLHQANTKDTDHYP